MEILILFLYIILSLSTYFITIIKYKVFFLEKIIFLFFSFLAGISILNIWLVSLFLLIFSLLGESTNFYLGKTGNLPKRKFLKETKYKDTIKLFMKYNDKSLFIGSLLGLYSGIISLLAGIYNINVKSFLKYIISGKVIGVGKYILLGYLIGNTYFKTFIFAKNHIILVVFILILLFYGFSEIRKKFVWTKFKNLLKREKKYLIRTISKNIFYYMFIFVFLYLLVLYLMFFVFESYFINDSKTSIKTYSSINKAVKNYPYNVYFSKEKDRVVQPINVIIVGDNIKEKFRKIGWTQNSMFGYSNISIKKYINLLKEKKLPVINLFLQGKIQDMAFQEKSNSIKKRNHIRLRKKGELKSGKNIYFGAISNDIGFELGVYNTFLVPIHDFDTNIDKSRDQLLKNFKINFSGLEYSYKNWGEEVKKNEENEQYFFTDGKVVVIRL